MAFAAVNVLNQALERKVSAPVPECYFMHHSSQLWAKFRLLKQILDFIRSTFSTFWTISHTFCYNAKNLFSQITHAKQFSGPFWHNTILSHGQNSRFHWNHLLAFESLHGQHTRKGAIRLFPQWEMQSTFWTAPLYIP